MKQMKLWQFTDWFETTSSLEVSSKFCYHGYYHFWIGIFVDDWVIHHLYLHNPSSALYSMKHLPADRGSSAWWNSPWSKSHQLSCGGWK